MQPGDGGHETEAEAGAGRIAARLQPHEAIDHPLPVGVGDARPLSATVSATPSTRSVTATKTRPPAGVYLMALSTRLASAWDTSDAIGLDSHGRTGL